MHVPVGLDQALGEFFYFNLAFDVLLLLLPSRLRTFLVALFFRLPLPMFILSCIAQLFSAFVFLFARLLVLHLPAVARRKARATAQWAACFDLPTRTVGHRKHMTVRPAQARCKGHRGEEEEKRKQKKKKVGRETKWKQERNSVLANRTP